MEAKDLRIGNYVQDEDGIFQITKSFFYLLDNNLKDVAAIPLTEEWLLKFGFIESTLDEDNKWLFLKYRYLSFQSDNSVEFKKVYLTVNKMDIICEYVHQLQNLYYALTNEELILT